MLGAVYDFILAYAPEAKQDNIFRGWQNRLALPQTQEFIVISVQDTLRIGTNVNNYAQSANNKITTTTLREYIVDVDFCNINQETAQKQAALIESIGRSYIAVDFFEKYDISFNYCDDVEYVPYIDEQDQYLHRYRVSLHFTKWEEATVQQEYFSNVKLRVENIDVHHKP